MRIGAFLSAAVAAAALSSMTAAAEPPPSGGHHRDSCISPTFIDGISASDTHTAYLSVGPNDLYRLDMMGPCMNLDWPMTPKRLVDKMGAGGDICEAADMVLIVGHGERCYVSNLHKMTPAEIQAWRQRKP